MSGLAKDWITSSIHVRLDVRSVKDTNGDGIGDIPGLISKLDYYQDIGIGALQLSGHMPTDFAYAGTMHTGYYDVDPRLGTLEDFDRLIEEAHERSMAVVSTWAPFSTHPDHPYFQASRDPNNPEHRAFRDYYTWGEDINEPLPHPLARGQQIGHWEWDELRGSYFHATWKTLDGRRWCPETNPYSRKLVQESERLIRFWLERGMDGFWIDCGDKGDFWSYADHARFWKKLNGVIHSYPNRLSASEDGTFIQETIDKEGFDQFWCGNKPIPVHQTVFRDAPSMLVMGPGSQAYNGIHEILISFYQAPRGNRCSQTYTLRETVDFRSPSDTAKAKQYLALALTLPVVPTLEMGVECGWNLVEYDLWSQYRHSPMMWDSSPGYGFTDAEPFTPFNPKGYPPESSVQSQLAEPDSVLSTFKKLALLRRETPALQANEDVSKSYLRIATEDDNRFYAYIRRSTNSEDPVLVCVNLDDEAREISLLPHRSGTDLAGRYQMIDLWNGKHEGAVEIVDADSSNAAKSAGVFEVTVPAHGFRILRLQKR